MRNRGWKFRVTSLLTLKIVECLGTDVATKISQIHAATGRDKTYMFLLKLKSLNGKENLRLLNTIAVSCKVSDTIVEDA